MSDSYLPLMKAIIAKLRADAPVGALIADRIFTEIPQKETFPYAYVQINSGDFSTKDFTGMEHSVEIKVFSQKSSPKECGQVRSAIYNALNRIEDTLTLDSGTVASVNFINALMLKEDDGVTWQGVLQFDIVIT